MADPASDPSPDRADVGCHHGHRRHRPTKIVSKGKIVTPEQVIDGELVIEGDQITCVATSCTDPPDATRLTVTNAYILPGFVDAHNHVACNVLPRWQPPKLYKNRGQWQGSDAYKIFKKPYDDLTNKGLTCEMIKYGEVGPPERGHHHSGDLAGLAVYPHADPQRREPGQPPGLGQPHPHLHSRHQ
jgi:cytosine/adenosine deaminase-related metal-dependent hydrolase